MFFRYKWLETLLYIVIGIAPSVIIFEMVSTQYNDIYIIYATRTTLTRGRTDHFSK